MVLQKRLDYGFNGYQVPATPRATRSARRRGAIRKRVEDNSMGAFDLLATIAGKLLLEGDSSPAFSHTSKDQCTGTKENCLDGDKPLKVEPCDQGSCDRRIPISDHISQGPNQSSCSKESAVHQNESSVMTTSNCSERFASDMLVSGKCKNETGSFTSKIEAGSSGCREAGEFKLDGEVKTLVKDETNKSAKVLIGTGPGMCSLEDPVVWEGEPLALVSSDSSTKVPMYVDHIPQRSFPTSRDDVKVVSRDDDENSSGCTHPVTSIKYSRPGPSRIGDRRIRKILASKYWKVAPKLKDDIHSNSCKWLPCTKRMYRDQKPNYHNRKNCYKRQRSQMNIPFKKRKLFYRSAVLNTDEGISREGFFDSRDKGITGDASASCSKMQGATMVSSSLAGQHSSFQSRNSHVKVRIKSFRVPELFIEIPETASVGSLKKTVMDAVTAVLGGGLCVGVLLQGKKVIDDNKTLLQTGISQDNQLDSLGFTLEPNPSQTPPPLCSGDSPCMLPCDVLQPLTRYPSGPTSEASPEPHSASLGNFIESDHDSAPSPTDISAEKSTTYSKALVAVPDTSVGALAVVPGHRKSKLFDIGQRRIRRPFSVAEVEALVQAVEKLGTGRWRDVKLRAFDNAKHRTYVDLKDKWKTLVHTARISPQQRRGEPVPQELLDRVLTAHAYWSQQQAKQQLKQPETCLLV